MIQWSMLPAVGCDEIPVAEANGLLVAWSHYLGAIERPFGQQAFALAVDGTPVSLAVSASTVSATAAGYRRGEAVELARLATAPGERWATRVMVRLWRQVLAPRWPHWPVTAAIAYSQNDRHEGRIYRFDGWEKVRDDAGASGGGGTWSTNRDSDDPTHGRKTLWLWRYDDPQETSS